MTKVWEAMKLETLIAFHMMQGDVAYHKQDEKVAQFHREAAEYLSDLLARIRELDMSQKAINRNWVPLI